MAKPKLSQSIKSAAPFWNRKARKTRRPRRKAFNPEPQIDNKMSNRSFQELPQEIQELVFNVCLESFDIKLYLKGVHLAGTNSVKTQGTGIPTQIALVSKHWNACFRKIVRSKFTGRVYGSMHVLANVFQFRNAINMPEWFRTDVTLIVTNNLDTDTPTLHFLPRTYPIWRSYPSLARLHIVVPPHGVGAINGPGPASLQQGVSNNAYKAVREIEVRECIKRWQIVSPLAGDRSAAGDGCILPFIVDFSSASALDNNHGLDYDGMIYTTSVSREATIGLVTMQQYCPEVSMMLKVHYPIVTRNNNLIRLEELETGRWAFQILLGKLQSCALGTDIGDRF